jgi:hypothetical protein
MDRGTHTHGAPCPGGKHTQMGKTSTRKHAWETSMRNRHGEHVHGDTHWDTHWDMHGDTCTVHMHEGSMHGGNTHRGSMHWGNMHGGKCIGESHRGKHT